ncbi:caspase family protein [Calothrix sp. FACHB-1219]|uniref:caspase family protein n=1 Tax=unclassified Calothrix TaxID=2619626 RepID=UPI001682034B|nr:MULTISPECIES: caspase family protein [unclassified Calothrix]MBD2203704.1 caspase family protein [Calothrix sp. FACHB-168]MBD2222074.1 caspase family protein [Calothrix sp. FACHB-1219]
MTQIKRRQFLQFAGSTLASIGFSQLDIIHQGDKYAKVLAQNAPRKLALLVGINEYQNGIQPLRGCTYDVELQKQLLIHRFGFSSQDIVTLTDAQATRQNILTAFEQLLINQAKPGDIVVFHFSGHGSQVFDPDQDHESGLNSTLVPVDASLPPGYPDRGGVVNNIMGHTLFLLMSALKTDNVTVVLDCCHSGGAKRGNFLVRTLTGGKNLQAMPAEFEYQRQWLQKLNLSQSDFLKLRRQNIAKGVVLASAKRDQFAVDATFSGFYAGAFTYALTYYLWQKPANQSVNKVFADVSRTTANLAYQNSGFQYPELEVNVKGNSNPPLYFTPFTTSYADAVVTQSKGNEVELWLGGVDPRSLDAFNKENAAFTVVDSNGKERGLINLESRQGLVAKGRINANSKVSNQLPAGTILQERLRGIPIDITLKIGLDDLFDSNSNAQATQALKALNRITPVPLRQQEVQYIFGRMTQERYQQLQKFKTPNLRPVGSLGLFSPSLDQIIPKSFGEANETIPAAVERLNSKLKSLLAARIVKTMVRNTNTSRLKVNASMIIANSQTIVSESFTVRGRENAQKPANSAKIKDGEIARLPINTQIAFQVENQEKIPLYLSILVIDAEGEMAVIFPDNQMAYQEDAVLIEPGEKRVIPENDEMILNISEPSGITEALIIASTSPLKESLKALEKIAKRGDNTTRSPVPASDEFLDITDKLLEDLDTATRRGTNGESQQLPAGVRGVDTTKLAAMSITLEVVK